MTHGNEHLNITSTTNFSRTRITQSTERLDMRQTYWVRFRVDTKILPSSAAVFGHTQSPIRCVSRSLCPGVKGPER